MGEKCNLLPTTRQLLEHRPSNISLRRISDETGVNYHWLGKFAQGKFEDPGVQKIQRLHDYLVSLNGEGRAAQ